MSSPLKPPLHKRSSNSSIDGPRHRKHTAPSHVLRAKNENTVKKRSISNPESMKLSAKQVNHRMKPGERLIYLSNSSSSTPNLAADRKTTHRHRKLSDSVVGAGVVTPKRSEKYRVTERQASVNQLRIQPQKLSEHFKEQETLARAEIQNKGNSNPVPIGIEIIGAKTPYFFGSRRFDLHSTLDNAHNKAVYWCDISTTGTRLVSCSHDKLICIWDLRSGTLSRTLVGHAGPVLQVWFDPKDHNRLLSCSVDGTVRLWDLKLESAQIHSFKSHNGMVMGCGFSSDGYKAISCSQDRSIIVWNLLGAEDSNRGYSSTEFRSLRIEGAPLNPSGHTSTVMRAIFSNDMKNIASCSQDNDIKIWNAKTGRLLRILIGHTDHVLSICYSPDGSKLLSSSHDKTVRVWNAMRGGAERVLVGHTDIVYDCKWHPAQLPFPNFATSTAFFPSRMMSSMRMIQSLSSLHNRAGSFSAQSARPRVGSDGMQTQESFAELIANPHLVVSVSHDRSLILWNIDSATIVQRIPAAHVSWVLCCAFHPSGLMLVTASGDNTMKLWQGVIKPIDQLKAEASNICNIL